MRILLTSCLIFALAASVQANVITFGATKEFSGGTAPQGPSPWIMATFNDFGSTGTVQVTLAANNLVGTEFVSEWFLNLSPSLDPTKLTFTKIASSGSFTLPSISEGANAFKADGAGHYDFDLGFSTGGPSNRFTSGDWVTYNITGISSLTAASFNFATTDGGAEGDYDMAAHVQAIGSGSQSGWVGGNQTQVPEPATMALLAMGGLALLRRRRALAGR